MMLLNSSVRVFWKVILAAFWSKDRVGAFFLPVTLFQRLVWTIIARKTVFCPDRAEACASVWIVSAHTSPTA